MSHVLVVCAQKYNGHELWTALGVLQSRGHTFDLISTKTIIRDEITLKPNRIEQTIADVTYDTERYDGLMIVSGNMQDTELYWKHPKVLSYVETANGEDQPIAAICCSVPTIRHAAKGKKVSFFPLVRSVDLLTRAGAVLQTVAMTRDQNLVTAEHQMATEVWVTEFCNMLEGLDQSNFFHDSGFVPRGRPRKPIPEVEELRRKRRHV